MPRTHALIALGLLLLAGLFLADHDAWTPDEPRVVALGQSVARGSWVVPRLNGEPFLEQPPLHAWSVGGAYLALGERVWVARAVSAAWSILTLLVTYLLGARLANPRTGALAALLLGTSFLFFWAEHRVTADPALAFFVAGSTYASLRGLTAEDKGERTAALFLAYAGASLAYLAKGVVGIGLAGFGFVAVLVALRAPLELLRARLWLAPVAFGLVTASYHWRLYEECGLEGLKTVAYENTVTRAGTELQHAQPFYYYVWSFPLVFLPGTLFLAGAVAWWARGRAKLDARGRLAWEMPLAWLALGLVGLSIARSKREIYVLPVLPGGAVAGALWLEELIERRDESFLARVLPELLAVVLVLFAAALPVACFYSKQPWQLAAGGAVVAAAAAILGLVLIVQGKKGRGLAQVFAGAVAVLAVADFALVPWIDSQKALGPVLREAVALVPADRPLYAICPDETALGAIPFYTGREVAAIPSRSGFERIERPLELAPEVLAAHLHGQNEIWAIAIEKKDAPLYLQCVQPLRPEVVFVQSGTRTVELLHFRAK